MLKLRKCGGNLLYISYLSLQLHISPLKYTVLKKTSRVAV